MAYLTMYRNINILVTHVRFIDILLKCAQLKILEKGVLTVIVDVLKLVSLTKIQNPY